MAEAHSAVAFSFQVTHEGVNFQISSEAVKAVCLSGIRSWRKRGIRFLNRFQTGVYPAKFSSFAYLSVFFLISPYLGIHFISKYSCSIHNYIFRNEKTRITSLMSTMILSLGVWLLAVIFIRYLLKLLLCYQGWMYDQRGKVSTTTKLWSLGIRLLGGSNPQLYSFQSSLPRMPVPALKDTIQRYLLSVRPLLTDEKYDEMKKLSEEFENTIGPKLQLYLNVKSWWASNYVSDWWEDYIYLAGRDPIMVNSNYYGLDLLYYIPSNRQASRAASVVHYLFAFRSILDKEQIKPIMMQNMIPLCSAQYERIFNTSRIPGIEKDRLQHFSDCRHIIVIHQGRYFKFTCYKQGQLLEPCELEIGLEQILNDKSEPSPGEKHLAALTAGNRVPWAEAREKYFSNGCNLRSLNAIEKAAFVLVLDDETFELDDSDPKGLSAIGRSLLHGKCYDRWFDKSFNLVVYKNGRFGINAEHSWADAPVMSFLVEHVLGTEYLTKPFKEDGKCKGTPVQQPFWPSRLAWDFPTECIETIEKSLEVASRLANDVHLHVFAFKHFGKGLVKKFKMSPDAFIQAALQIAHLRDKGHFSLTYESSMTRLFREGRTETVRSCTNQMAAFAKSMDDPEMTNANKLELLRSAADRHTLMYKLAMTGQGIDRHLFCLYVVSKYKKVESPFLQRVSFYFIKNW